jgi:hypothetical protein
VRVVPMSVYVCHAYQLLPGDACPDYVYRYRFLGQAFPECFSEKELGTAFWALMAKCRSGFSNIEEGESVAAWLSSTHALWNAKRFTGWDPRTGLAFRFETVEQSLVPGQRWGWVLEKPRARRR